MERIPASGGRFTHNGRDYRVTQVDNALYVVAAWEDLRDRDLNYAHTTITIETTTHIDWTLTITYRIHAPHLPVGERTRNGIATLAEALAIAADLIEREGK